MGCIHKFEYTSTILEKTKSDFQEVELFDTVTYGKMLMLDAQVQSSVMDEFIYHESLVHPVMLSLPEPARRVFIGTSSCVMHLFVPHVCCIYTCFVVRRWRRGRGYCQRSFTLQICDGVCHG